MLEWLQHVAWEEKLKELGLCSLQKSKLRESLVSLVVLNHLLQGYGEDRARYF